MKRQSETRETPVLKIEPIGTLTTRLSHGHTNLTLIGISSSFQVVISLYLFSWSGKEGDHCRNDFIVIIFGKDQEVVMVLRKEAVLRTLV